MAVAGYPEPAGAGRGDLPAPPFDPPPPARPDHGGRRLAERVIEGEVLGRSHAAGARLSTADHLRLRALVGEEGLRGRRARAAYETVVAQASPAPRTLDVFV